MIAIVLHPEESGMFQTIEVRKQERIAIVTMNRPTRRNALSIQLMHDLIGFAHSCESDYSIDAVVVTGGTAAFSAGNDLKDEARWNISDQPFVAQRDIAATGFRLCKAWEEIPQITIAAIEGYAIGGGLAFALASDWRVIAEDAYVTLPEIGLGFPLTWGTIPRLVELLGPALAKRVVILGERIGASQALAAGLVDYTAPRAQALDRAVGIAARVCELPAASVRMSKEVINSLSGHMTRLASHASGDQFTLAAATDESRRARERALDRRKPV